MSNTKSIKPYFDSEANILEWVRDLEPNQCFILSDDEGSPNYAKTVRALDALIMEENASHWKDNTLTDLPPDFINEEDGVMLEVMRFDDHSPDGKKNPNLARQRKMAAEIEPFLDLFPNVQHVFLIPDTGLQTEEDHNYRFYYKAFQRTVKKHLNKLPSYRKNHPGLKTIFLVFDESSGVYFERIGDPNNPYSAHLYYPFWDERFLEVFEKSTLDYLILVCPFNNYQTTGDHLVLPNLTIFDIAHMNNGTRLRHLKYDESKMFSSEK